jgi:ATP/maltotriose-dependent transcriptional regulator MalT
MAVGERDAPRFYGRSRALLVQLEIRRGEYAAARKGCIALLRLVRADLLVLLPEAAYCLALLLATEGRDQEALAILTVLEDTPGEYATLQLAAELRATLEQRRSGDQFAAGAIAGQQELLAWLEQLATRPAMARPASQAPAQPVVPAGGLRVPETGEILSQREVEVLRLLLAGATNAQIADALIISRFTVKNHVARILEKLGVATRTQAALRGRELGLAPLTHR